jgi:integrase
MLAPILDSPTCWQRDCHPGNPDIEGVPGHLTVSRTPPRQGRWPCGGGPLLCQNFRKRIWEPAFKGMNLPYVTPHAARHSFISTSKAQGVEAGLVAQLAGHANPTVTLGHYTRAMRAGELATNGQEEAYGAEG